VTGEVLAHEEQLLFDEVVVVEEPLGRRGGGKTPLYRLGELAVVGF